MSAVCTHTLDLLLGDNGLQEDATWGDMHTVSSCVVHLSEALDSALFTVSSSKFSTEIKWLVSKSNCVSGLAPIDAV